MTRAYDKIAASLLAMTDDAGKWKPCWHHCKLSMPQNATTGRLYRGVNVLSLWVAAETQHYPSALWATYKQWAERECQVRKGETGTPIVFYGSSNSEDEAGKDKRIPFARSSWVFNAAQVDGWGEDYGAEASGLSDDERHQLAETFASGTGALINHSPAYDPPHYDTRLDAVNMPPFASFHDAEGYYSTLLHELTHWTGAAKRLDRPTLRRYHDSKDVRALEELVAELGAAFLCADLEISNEPRADHATYLANWHNVLKRDTPAFMHAVSQAAKAAEYLHELQAGKEQQRAA